MNIWLLTLEYPAGNAGGHRHSPGPEGNSASGEAIGYFLAAITAPTFGSFDFGNFFGTPKRPTTAKATPAVQPVDQRIATQVHQQTLGKIFGGTTFTLDTQLCFVLMPFDTKFQPLYDDHIKPSVEGAQLRCERADDIHGTSLITWDIWERINRARFPCAPPASRENMSP